MRKSFILGSLVLLVAVLAWQCDTEPELKSIKSNETEALTWLNHHDTVSYVGINTCMQCHANVHQSFIKTGMGQSLGAADTLKSIAEISGHQVLYDEYKDLSYQPYWQANQLWLKEFRLDENGDTSFQQEKRIDYVIGSGQHTNSHLWEENAYYHQAPFTWYAQEGKLDFPPGFEAGNNSRFNREIGLECMSCHNAMPTKFVIGSTNKFRQIPQGIDCERCHGPGGAHVAKIMRGEITDTSVERDPTIVNPKRLSAQLQFEICQRCHLQGNAVLKSGKSFFDFKPGMELKEILQVYLPRYEQSEDRFIMASHADRFKLSACFQSAPEQFTCTSCHNPHISVKETNTRRFNNSCGNCHGGQEQIVCSERLEERLALEDNCVACHMPPSQATDIPHVSVHDHFIRKPQKLVDQLKADGVFIRLESINDPAPSPRDKALAYLQQFERFGARPFYLDSAAVFLNQVERSHPEHLYLWTYYFHLSANREELFHFAEQFGVENILNSLKESETENRDAWTAYRLAEAYKFKGAQNQAIELYRRAVELAPFIADFRNKLASLLFQSGDITAAEAEWKKVLTEQSYHRESLNNLAYLLLQQRRNQEAAAYLEVCLDLYPDYELAWQNQLTLAMQNEDAPGVRKALESLLRINPQNQSARNLYRKFFDET